MLTISSKDIESSKTSLEIIQKVALQIQKDFQLYEEDLVLNNEPSIAYDQLFSKIHPIIDKMLNLDSARFFSLLYAIDVDEQKVKKLIFGHENINTSVEISHLILERELFKVLSREMYSSGRII